MTEMLPELAEWERLCDRLAACRPGVFPAGYLPAIRIALPVLIEEVKKLEAENRQLRDLLCDIAGIARKTYYRGGIKDEL